MPLLIQGKESTSIPDGLHQGTITSLKRREPRDDFHYDYLDVYVQVSDVEGTPEIKDGMPFNLTPNTKLGRLVMKFGVSEDVIKSKQDIDLEQILLNKEVTFQTLTEETDRGKFARIVDGSLKPKAAAAAAPSYDYKGDKHEHR